MIILPGKPISYWIDSTYRTSFPTLENVKVDVAIVGAGITGITAAYLLKKAGKTVALIDAKPIAARASGHTTAKVTSLHQLIYADLIEKIGEEKARLYGKSNQTAVEFVASTVALEDIDCDFQRKDNYTFAENESNLSKVQQEYNAAVKLGLPAEFVTETTLPFKIAGAVKFTNQAQFHVRKYLLQLANKIPGNGSYVFENSRVQEVEEAKVCKVSTEENSLEATDVLLTTHLPIMNQGLFFAKTYPKRSYIIGAKISPEQAPDGMFIGVGKNYHSIRTTPTEDGNLLLLIGGGGHKAGEISETEKCYQELESYLKSKFGIEKIDYRWSNQDYESFDRLPYIGRLTPSNQHIYLATGFGLWGMSNGTMAGIILSDLVQGKTNEWSNLYDSLRATPFVTKESIKNNLEVGVHWVKDRIEGLKNWSTDDVKPGEAKIITKKGEQIGVYKDETGKVTAVSAICSHLGCVVNWNSAEKTWDCPCHGGRFTSQGKLIQAPPIKDLEQKTL